MGQFNDLFKMLLDAHEEYNALLEDEARLKEDEWFDEIDNQVFSFKRKITCWLKNAEEDNKSKSSSTILDKIFGTKWSNPVKLDRKRKV